MPDDVAPTAVSRPRRRLLADAKSPPSRYIDVIGMPWETVEIPGNRAQGAVF